MSFDVKFLVIDANEGCDITDLDGDGKLDVVAGKEGTQILFNMRN